MKNYERLKGLVAAAFTPMNEKGDVNFSVIEQYAKHLIDTKMTGVFVCGTTGESASLTIDEQKEITKQWVKYAGGKIRVITHVGNTSQRQAMELAQNAQNEGANAIASIAPYFFKPANVRDLVNFFAPIAGSAPDLPFYFYDMPSMSGVDLPLRDFLIEGKKVIPNLVGVKFTHNNFMEMGDCIRLNNGEFEILNGYDEMMIAGLAFGSVAGVGSTYNYIASVYHGIIEAMSKCDIKTAREFQMKSIDIVKVIIKYGGGVRGGKAIMNIIGIPCGSCRLPITPFSDTEYSNLKSDLKQIGFM